MRKHFTMHDHPAVIGIAVCLGIVFAGAFVAAAPTFFQAAVTVENAADWLGFAGALLGAAATIVAGAAAFLVAQKGIAEQRTMTILSLLNLERDRVAAESPGLQDAKEYALSLWLRVVDGEYTGEERCDFIAEFICGKADIPAQPFLESKLNIRKVVEAGLPRTPEPIRMEFVRALEMLSYAFGTAKLIQVRLRTLAHDEEIKRGQAEALKAVENLYVVAEIQFSKRAKTYRIAEEMVHAAFEGLHNARPAGFSPSTSAQSNQRTSGAP